MLIDLHNDVIPRLAMDGQTDLRTRNLHGATDLVRLKEGGVNAQVFVAFCNGSYRGEAAFAYAMEMIDRFEQLVDSAPDRVRRTAHASEIPAIVGGGKIAALLAVEGGHMIADDMGKLETLRSRGMIYLTLTWNNSTSWATSAVDEVNGVTIGGKKGLTDKGKDIVARMNELGVVVDLSHAGEQTFYDVMNTSHKPVMASHSNAYRLAPHCRNLKDEQLAAIRENRGLVGVNFYAGFVDVGYQDRFEALVRANADLATEFGGCQEVINGSVDTKATFLAALSPTDVASILPSLNRLIEHIDYMVDIAGIDHVAIGSDFDGAEAYVSELHDVSSFPLLLARLKSRGYSPSMVDKLAGGNALRVLMGHPFANIDT